MSSASYPTGCGEVGLAHFFCRRTEVENMTDELELQIAERLNAFDPEIELVALEQMQGDSLRLYIDHPGGVDLGLCERVTGELTDFLARFSLEVSSPGADRPLTKPEHFQRFAGRRAKVRTSVQVAGRTGFTGRIAGATPNEVELEAPDGTVKIPFESIRRSNLVPEAA